MLGKNLIYLRKKNKISQSELAEQMGVARTTLGDYERGKTEPNIATLLKIAKYFKISVDALINQNISHQDLEVIRNQDMRVLAISVDTQNRQNIELVDSKAEAGYLHSFQDPEFIKELPKLFLPQLSEGTYRAFEIQGNSMLPIEPGSIVICRYVESLKDVKERKTYVVVTQEEGLVYKRLYHHQHDQQTFIATSDNPSYPPYEIHAEAIAELWQYHAHISFSDIQHGLHEWLESNIHDIQGRLNRIEMKIS